MSSGELAGVSVGGVAEMNWQHPKRDIRYSASLRTEMEFVVDSRVVALGATQEYAYAAYRVCKSFASN